MKAWIVYWAVLGIKGRTVLREYAAVQGIVNSMKEQGGIVSVVPYSGSFIMN